jgi:hypothetical protein
MNTDAHAAGSVDGGAPREETRRAGVDMEEGGGALFCSQDTVHERHLECARQHEMQAQTARHFIARQLRQPLPAVASHHVVSA